jgi:hypothetical protein
MRRRRALLVSAVLLLASAGWLYSQGAFHELTTITVFVNGFKLGTERLSGMTRSSSTGVQVGGTDVSVTIAASSAQDSALTVPANSIGGAEVSGMRLDLLYCGQADENGTIYLSPTAGVNGVDLGDGVDYSISGTACDGLDGATETTQDLIVFPDVAFKVMGFYCRRYHACPHLYD